MPKKASDGAAYLEKQTEECIRTAHLTPVQAAKVRKLRAGKAKAIRANTAMSNTAMTTKQFTAIRDILLRIIAITQVLTRDGESHDACAKLETINEDMVQDTDRALQAEPHARGLDTTIRCLFRYEQHAPARILSLCRTSQQRHCYPKGVADIGTG